MRPVFVVVPPPGLDQHLGLEPIPEPLHAQALITELAVEALGGAILPRLARFDEGGLDAFAVQPAQDGPADELRAVVGTKIARCAMFADQLRQHFDDPPRPDAALHNGKTHCDEALRDCLVPRNVALNFCIPVLCISCNAFVVDWAIRARSTRPQICKVCASGKICRAAPGVGRLVDIHEALAARAPCGAEVQASYHAS